MIVVIPSVEHTGSRLLANHIFHSFEHLSLDRDCTPEREAMVDTFSEQFKTIPAFPSGDAKYYDHVDPVNTPRFVQLAEKHTMIVPLRHPLRCAFSWEQRQKSLDRFFQQWDLIIEQIDAVNPAYLRVDLAARNDDLLALNERFDLSLETIWPYVGERSWPYVGDNTPGIVPLEDCKLRNETEVLKYIDANKAFFGAHYD